MKKIFLFIVLFVVSMIAQQEGDVIINEIGNGGTKKALYNGGDYVELLILKDAGVKLAGWYLTDLSSPGGTCKETEGYIRFSDKPGSVFNQVLPKGTYVLICLGDSRLKYGNAEQTEKVELGDDHRIVVFAGESKNHLEADSGTVALTGKDNLCLASAWNKKSAVDIVTWEGATNWIGTTTQIPLDQLENGEIIYFVPKDGNFADNTAAENWVSTSDALESTPGRVNKSVDDSKLYK